MDEKVDQSKRPEDSDFKQQRLKAWQPLLTPVWVISTFSVIGVIFLPIGIVILDASNKVVESSTRYDNLPQCATLGQSCLVEVPITSDMKPTVYVYYELRNYYQNHRRYVKSRSDKQLRGTITDTTDCSPADAVGPTPVYPCGLIATSFFNDSYTACLKNSGGSCGAAVALKETDIAWSSDKSEKFIYKNVTGDPSVTTVYNGVQLPDVNNEHFIVWMRTAGLPNFRKLWATIDQTLSSPNTLLFNVTNNYPVSSFSGEKYIVVSTTSWLGGKNPFLGWAYIVVGILCLVLAIIFSIKHSVSPRRLGDMQYFHWSGNVKDANAPEDER